MLIVCWPHVFLSTKYCGVPMFTCELSISPKSYLLPKLLCGFKICHRRANTCALSGTGYVYWIDTFTFFHFCWPTLIRCTWKSVSKPKPLTVSRWAVSISDEPADVHGCHQTFGYRSENNIAWFDPEKGGTIATTSGLREGWYHICFYIKLFRWIFRSMCFRQEQ